MTDKFIKIPKGQSIDFFGKKIKIKEDIFLVKENSFEKIMLDEAIDRAKKMDKLILKEIDRTMKKQKGGDKSMNKTYIMKTTILVKARSLDSAYKKLELLTKKKSFQLVQLKDGKYFEYAGAVKK